jgi:formylglycine-generating enzyme required for sulfatase activity
MVVIPAGSFLMGSPAGEKGREADEGPQHRVRIAKSFALGKYEVTFAEYDACVAAGGCSKRADQGWGRGRRPAINVSWNDAQTYVKWLSARTGQTYRLPSEAEWEYAARAGTQTRYAWGNDLGKNRANCYSCGSRWDAERTAPVGSFAANRWGLHDMHGNVWEWTMDCWHDTYRGAPADGSAWTTGGKCGARVLRGGSWDLIPSYLRSAVRVRRVTGYRSGYGGFRVARTLP